MNYSFPSDPVMAAQLRQDYEDSSMVVYSVCYNKICITSFFTSYLFFEDAYCDFRICAIEKDERDFIVRLGDL